MSAAHAARKEISRGDRKGAAGMRKRKRYKKRCVVCPLRTLREKRFHVAVAEEQRECERR